MHALISHTVFIRVRKLCRSNRAMRFQCVASAAHFFILGGELCKNGKMKTNHKNQLKTEGKQMKKFLAILMALVLVVLFCSCGTDKKAVDTALRGHWTSLANGGDYLFADGEFTIKLQWQ